jgi:glycosyltransferase involved in cell wall biosynthesis
MKKLAVLLSAYNTSAYLKESINSVPDQIFNDFGFNEIILIIEDKYWNNLRGE